MPLRTAFAAALRFLRARRDLSQGDLALIRDQSHVSRLEAGQRGVTLQASDDLAKALGVEPMTLLAVAYAAEHGTSPREVLNRLETDLRQLRLLDDCVPLDAPPQLHPVVSEAETLRSSILELKGQGLSQAEIGRRLGVSGATVSRHLKNSK
ncbi:helix-turn-helix domain-containing protein [Enterobacterales bacterium BD_CKDN230030183-1A_HGKHYDSX7]